MPTNSQPLDLGGAFYLDESGLRTIVGVITKFTGSGYSVSAKFDDEFSHRTGDIETLIEHPHFRISKCKTLSFSSSTSYPAAVQRDVQISFRQSLGQGSAQVSISSDDDNIHIVKAELEREIRSFRTKYDILYRLPWFTWYLFGGACGIAIGAKLSDAMISASTDKTKEALTNITVSSMGVTIFFSFVALYWLNKIKLIAYPTFTVAIGRQRDRFSSLQDTRKWTYRAIVAAAAGLLTKKFFDH